MERLKATAVLLVLSNVLSVRCVCFTDVAMITINTVFISATTRKNVALDKNTFASSSIVNHQVLVDGQYSDGVKIKSREWVGVDLGQTEHVDSVQVYFKHTSSKKRVNLLNVNSSQDLCPGDCIPSGNTTQRTLHKSSGQIVALCEYQHGTTYTNISPKYNNRIIHRNSFSIVAFL